MRVILESSGSPRPARDRGKERPAVKPYKKMLEEIADWEPELINQYIQEEIEKTQWEAFSTTIKHLLVDVC